MFITHAFMIFGMVTSSYGKMVNSCGPVLSYFFALPVALVANGCTVSSFFSKIATSLRPLLLAAVPHDLSSFLTA